MQNPDYIYCPRCASKLQTENKFGGLRSICPNCGWIHFIDPKVAAAVLIIQQNKVLLVSRANEPFQGMWTLPAGFVNGGEDPSEAAERECLEETGLTIRVRRVRQIVSGKEHPRGADFVIVYDAEIVSGEMIPDDDADAVDWFPLNDLPPLAFQATQKVLQSLHA